MAVVFWQRAVTSLSRALPTDFLTFYDSLTGVVLHRVNLFNRPAAVHAAFDKIVLDGTFSYAGTAS
jgi:hypothetical protein